MLQKEIIDFKNGIEFSDDKIEAIGISRNLTDPNFYKRFSYDIHEKMTGEEEKRKFLNKVTDNNYIQSVVNLWSNSSDDSTIKQIPSLIKGTEIKAKNDINAIGNIPFGGIKVAQDKLKREPIKVAKKKSKNSEILEAAKLIIASKKMPIRAAGGASKSKAKTPVKGKGKGNKTLSDKAVTRTSAIARLKKMNLLKSAGGPLKGKRRETRMNRIEQLLNQKFKKVGQKYKLK